MYEIDYAKELNEAQYQAATTLEGPVLVIAGAGSGKTRTVVYRLAYMVESGIPTSQILLLTFTRKASQEMLRRFWGTGWAACTAARFTPWPSPSCASTGQRAMNATSALWIPGT